MVIIIKPDAVVRELEQDIIDDFTQAGFEVGDHMVIPIGDTRWRNHYIGHAHKAHYEDMCAEYAERPAIAFEVFMGNLSFEAARELTMKLRTKYADMTLTEAQRRRHNSVHCSDSPDDAEHELSVWGL